MSLQSKKSNPKFELNYFLPGTPLTPKQLVRLIKSSRNSGVISMQDAHQKLRDSLSKAQIHVQNHSSNS